jgi:uncharacterized membrane protein YbhN (UPF0104 family)
VKRRVALAAATALAVLLLAAVASRTDAAALASAAREARGGWLAALVVAYAANHALRIARWRVVLGAGSWRRASVICVIAFLGITLLPLRLGELIRPALHARDGIPVGRTVAALLVERILDLVALGALLAAVAATLPPIEVDGVAVTGAAQRVAAVGIAVLGAGLAVGAAVGERLEGWPVVGPSLAALARAARELARDPGRAAVAVALTAATWGSSIAYTGCALGVLPSLPQSASAAATTWAGIIATITALPTPGFVGSYEAGAAAALSLYGADPAKAVVLGLGLHATYVAFTAIVGVPFAIREVGR